MQLKKYTSLICMLLCTWVSAQYKIVGPLIVKPGTNAFFYVSDGSSQCSYCTGSWSLMTGGDLSSKTNNSCYFTAPSSDNADGYSVGMISYSSYNGYYMPVYQFVVSNNYLDQRSQMVEKGKTGTISFNYYIRNNQDIKNISWQQSSDKVLGWYTIAGSSTTLQVPYPTTSPTYYRCVFSYNGQTITTEPSEVLAEGYENLSYVRTNRVLVPGMQNIEAVSNLPIGQRFQLVNYLDGLGRTTETIRKDAAITTTGTSMDLVSFNTFDEYGRQDKSYLPFPTLVNKAAYKPNPEALQTSALNGKFESDNYFYSKNVFDNSPLNRITKSMRPGVSWVGSNVGVNYTYDCNNSTEIIKKWSIGYSSSDRPVTTGKYDAAKLVKNTATDEKGKRTITYSDFSGQTILVKVQDKEGAALEENGHGGWLCTYYVYDGFGRLRYKLTPGAVELLRVMYDVNATWSVNEDIAAELCYYNIYDNRGRIIAQHSPGAGENEIVYDKRNRPIFTRDAKDKQLSRWMLTCYDALNRPILSGFISTSYDRAYLQTYLDGQALANSSVSFEPSTSAVLPQLVVGERVAGTEEYTASEEIVFNPGFESEASANFIAQISTGTGGNASPDISLLGNPVPAGITIVTLSVNFYDDYAYGGAKTFSDKYGFPATSNAYVLATKRTERTLDMLTGRQVRVIDDNNYNNDGFSGTTIYYNEDGNTLQVLSDNYFKGTDIYTSQYDFSGKELANCLSQTLPGTSLKDFRTVTGYEYDILGRLQSLSKSYGGSVYKKLVQYTYDELGRTTQQKLSPSYNGNAGIERLDYNYSIHGALTGINKNYALQTANNQQWNNYFGEYLGYDNRDAQFSAASLNGNISGVIWKSQSDNKPRRYDYNYTNAGYLNAAQFVQKEKPSDSWSAAKMNASVPTLQYDANGNLLAMSQMGLRAGQSTPALIDDLIYGYDKSGYSNRLVSVTDRASNPANPPAGADFTNGTGLPANHYTYDAAGNLTRDYNKGMGNAANEGILYNILNRPCRIEIQGKYSLSYIYDADGALLAKKITNTATGSYKWQYFVDGLALENNTPLYFSNETGRLRISKVSSYAISPAPSLTIGGNDGLVINGKPAFYDFYITDHQGSTRMVLTEEQHAEMHLATMEDRNADQKAYEESTFGKQGSGNEVVASRWDTPPAWASHYNDAANRKVSRLNQGLPVGPNVLLKVMAGDMLKISTDYFYNEAVTTGSNGLSNVVNSLVGALSGSGPAAGLKGAASQLQSQLLNSGDLANFLNNPDGVTNNNLPRAYLNWLFFDENFNPIPSDATTGNGSGAMRVTGSGDGKALVQSGIKVPASGYAFVYVSNTSSTNVYFDNLKIIHERGRILQEHHYYPYGLEIASISSRAFGKLDNGWRYQGTFSEFEEETGWTNFDLRSYDAQLGRWTSVDPYDQYASGYVGMGSNPVNGVDEDGGLSIPLLFATTAAGAGIGYLMAPEREKGRGALIGAGIGLGAGIIANISLNGIMDYADPHKGVYAQNVYDNYADRFEKYTKEFSNGYWSRSFDAWVDDKLSDLFSNSYHFLGSVTNSKFSWITIDQLSSSMINIITREIGRTNYEMRYVQSYAPDFIERSYDFKGMGRQMRVEMGKGGRNTTVDIFKNDEKNEVLNNDHNVSRIYKVRKNVFKVRYNPGYKTEYFSLPIVNGQPQIPPVTVSNSKKIKIQLRVKNNHTY
ncbi:DUF6443 domain-containing protein [Danxiaibacter flavus]|uniref:DUF6443 domain-containing protein n=1 Tax=Danxiaibacter flavus TaxID=3049108 RepID=A0ABV3ZLE9_9BACT|nr:DUF6443 domain-containing protein [Chitinophagaceae bacterium DXS]